jgi:dienelactone hydrolase
MNFYTYPTGEPRFSLRLDARARSWSRYAVDFPLALPRSYYGEGNTVRGELYRPAGNSSGSLAILIHGWGDRILIPCRMLAKSLAANGIAAYVPFLIFHPSRMPAVMKAKGYGLSPEEWWDGYQTSVIEIRQVVDWAKDPAKPAFRKVSIIGVSLGGIVAAIAMGVEKRLDAGIFIDAGGNYETPAWRHSKQVGGGQIDYRQAREQFAAYLAQVREKGFDGVAAPKRSYLTDPVTFAADIGRRPVMMINARWDEMIPKSATLDMWQALGRPPINWYPAAHASIWLFYPLIRRRILDFLRINQATPARS